MKILRIGCVTLLLPLICTFAHAGAVASSWQKITEIDSGWDIRRVNIIAPDIPNPGNMCTATSKAQADENLANLDYLMSTALAAFMAGKEVKLLISDSGCSAGGYPRIIGINVR